MTNLLVTLFLCGDVMTGRGIDQVLPYQVEPILYEQYVRDARDYVTLAERANGSIDAPVSFDYIWGDALAELRATQPDARIINLETSITTHDKAWPGKGINYRMHPKNVAVLSAAEIDCCVLANNHTLDWNLEGLQETLDTLAVAGIQTAGAGRNAEEAKAPAVMELAKHGRVLVFALGATSSGIPSQWEATQLRGGLELLESASAQSVQRLAADIDRVRRSNDVVVVSLHWGGNWGYAIPKRQVELAHQLIDVAHVDLVHGHSSHHAKAFEVYENKLVLYGCGDFVNDYEGISGHEKYRGDLGLMYFPTFDLSDGRLVKLRMVPMQMRRFQLHRAARQDVDWLRDVLARECRRFGGRVVVEKGDLVWQQGVAND